MKKTPRLGQIRGQSSSGALGLQLLGFHGLELSLEGADPLLCLIALSDGLVALPMRHAVLGVEPLRGLAQLISLLTQSGNHLNI